MKTLYNLFNACLQMCKNFLIYLTYFNKLQKIQFFCFCSFNMIQKNSHVFFINLDD